MYGFLIHEPWMTMVLHWILSFGVSEQLCSQLNRSIEMERPPHRPWYLLGLLWSALQVCLLCYYVIVAMNLHLNPPLVSDVVSLSGGSSCKWYINLEVPEAKALAARWHAHLDIYQLHLPSPSKPDLNKNNVSSPTLNYHNLDEQCGRHLSTSQMGSAYGFQWACGFCCCWT